MATHDSSPPPIALLFDLLGRRWALRVLWELREERLPFGELQSRCDGMSTSVLSQRLTELREAGLIEPQERQGYALTPTGSTLIGRLRWFDEWASEWAEQWQSAAGPAEAQREQGRSELRRESPADRRPL